MPFTDANKRGGTDDWYTPPEIVEGLGNFDLDPATGIHRPFDTAKRHLTVADDGLAQAWEGRVWLNPPYSQLKRKDCPWAKRMAEHHNGIMLTFARMGTAWCQDWVLGHASAILFIRGRLTFYEESGTRASNTAGAPSMLVAYDENYAGENSLALYHLVTRRVVRGHVSVGP